LRSSSAADAETRQLQRKAQMMRKAMHRLHHGHVRADPLPAPEQTSRDPR